MKDFCHLVFTAIFVCVSLCVSVWSLGFYYTWFSPLSQSIFLLIFKLATSCISCLGFFTFIWNTDEFSAALESQLQFLPGPNILPVSESPYLGQTFSFLFGSSVSQVAHLASWTLMWFWYRLTSISTCLQLCKIGIIKSKGFWLFLRL